ncbi:MAG: EamA family transporter [Anaerolineaceae bacterium]|jgi:drug/metabolite transporter (DMT)-like permease|nr:EamA family transporter [Anaerolineaceae bacterium]
MVYLLVVSIIWAFSFGLIKNQLAGLDANFIAAARLLISLLVFLPFLRVKGLTKRQMGALLLVGAVEYGIMYIAYNYAFLYLQAYEVALFTIFTPIYVTLINDAMRRRMHWVSLLATVATVVGTAIVRRGGVIQSEILTGFLIVQISNLGFAFGQVYYREVMKNVPVGKRDNLKVFGLLYLGGFLTAGVSAAVFTPWQAFSINSEQIVVLLYLGAIASGLGFFLWNVGARKVNAGSLAIFNDLKVPLAVIVSIVFFGEQANWLNLLVGGGIAVAALIFNEWYQRRGKKDKTVAAV